MSWRYLKLCTLLGALSMWTGTSLAQEEARELAPHSARVVMPGAAVRSGPADSFYLTDTLPEGETVEVYRRTADGWCAIRPPAHSFSWVYARHVNLLDGDVATIASDDVAARVGSRLSSHRDVVQVRLHKGEKVQVVGKDQLGTDTWLKISPPSGEFRWMQAKDIAWINSDGELPAETTQVTAASHEEPLKTRTEGAPVVITAPPLASGAPIAAQSTSSTTTAIAKPNTDITPVPAPAASTAELAQRLNEIEIRLSRMVSEPVVSWNVESIEQTTETLLSQADSVADRDAVKATLAKVDRFAAIQRRYVNTNPGANFGPVTSAAGTTSPTVTAQAVGVPGAAGAAGGPFDAVGVLRPVVSRRPGAPQYALVDEQGQVVSFITPTPDVNLQPYLGHRIGVVGTRGYVPEFRRAHVTAGRVTPLNERIVR